MRKLFLLLTFSLIASAQATFSPWISWPEYFPLGFGASSCQMTTSGTQCAYVTTIPASGNLTDIAFATSGVTTFAAGDTMTVTLETVSAGNPTGTAYKSSTGFAYVGGVNNLTANTAFLTTLATQATGAVLGDIIAVRFTMTTYNAANFNLSAYQNAAATGPAFPYGTKSTNSGSTWTKSFGQLKVGFKIGGVWYMGDNATACIPSSVVLNNSVATYDQYGATFTMAAATVIAGIWAEVGLGNASTTAGGVLYDASHNVISTSTASGDTVTSSALAPYLFRFSAPQTLAAGAQYTIAISATSASGNNTSVSLFTCPSGAMALLPAGSTWYTDRHTRGGSWGTVATERPAMGLLITSIATGSSGAVVSPIGQ